MSFGKKIVGFLNRIIPKKNIVLLSSFPPFRDNALALYQYIILNRRDLILKYRFYWAQKEASREKISYYVKEGGFVVPNSIKGIWLFLRAKYVISTHNFFSDVYSGKGQIQVNLWHGNGYKVIPPSERVYRGDFTIVTSSFFQPITAAKLGIEHRNVWVTGLPRNDNLFHPCEELSKITEHRTYKKVILWMPTYRKALFNHDGIDGNTEAFGLKTFLHNDFGEFNELLKRKEYLLLIKPHPMDELCEAKVESTNNIIFFTDKTIEELHINLYCLLAETDALISDYSSVVIDYLLVNKPIGMVCADLEEYRSNRGFVLNPVKDYLPGPIITTREELMNFIIRIDEYDEEWKEKRQQLKDMFHQYQDDRSCERVCNSIFDNTNKLVVNDRRR